MNPTDWLTTRQAAEYAGGNMHADTIRDALRAQELHGTQRVPGRSDWRVQRHCVDAWLLREPCPHRRQGKVA